MAKAKTKKKVRPATSARSAPTRRPAPARGRRRGWLAAGVATAAIALVAVVVMVATGGEDSEDPGVPASADGSASAVTGGDFHSLVADPTTLGRLFAGGHQSVSVSTDGGTSWREVDALRDADAMGWAFAADAVYVSGHPGLNRSTDDAGSFARINEGLPGTDLHAFGAGGDTLYGAAAGVGVFTSGDRGGTWQMASTDPSRAFFGRILVDADDEQHLVAADARSGPVESTDGGRTWRELGAGVPATWVSGSADLEQLIASGPEGAIRSTDGGVTWQLLELPDGASLVEMAPAGDALYAGVHRPPTVEVYVSRDGGATWERP